MMASPTLSDENLLCPSVNESEDDSEDSKSRSRGFETIEEFESPASFPATPFSRAQVMNRNAESN